MASSDVQNLRRNNGGTVKLLRRGAILLGLSLLLSDTAMADPKDDARRHFRSGLEAAQEGQYEIALQHFLSAQEAYPHPATLYNIARAYTDLNDIANALTYYRLYRDAAPDAAADVDPVIQVLEARMGQSQTPVVVGTGGQGSGAAGVVVTGPTAEEIARLQAIAAELEALSQTITTRTEQEIAAAASQPSVGPDGEGVGPDGGEVDLTELALPDGGFIADAYERIVVTASRYGQEPLDSPSTTSVLSADDIKLSGATTIPDVLRRVAGVDVMQLASGHQDVSIRGFNRELNNKVLILIDGRSVYWDFIGGPFWQSLPISLEDIERIEVIRGPGSAVYGANAVTGVVNLITKTPGEEEKTLIRIDAGSPAYGRGTMTTSGRKGVHAWRVSAGYQQRRRWAQDQQTVASSNLQPTSPTLDEGLGEKTVRINGRLDRTFGTQGFASLQAGFVKGDVEIFNIGALGDYQLGTESFYVRGDAAYEPVHVRVFWNANYAPTQGSFLEATADPNSLTGPVDNDVVDVEIETPAEFSTGPLDHKFNAGIGYRYKRIQFPLLAGGYDSVYNEHHFSAFLNEEMSLGRLKMVASLRADRHPLIPNITKTLSPRAAVIVRAARNTAIRATGGTAFRAPNSVESYMDWNLASTATGAFIRDLGDRRLDPERIWTAELGIHDESSDYHQADMVVYYNRVSKLIGLDSVTSQVAFFDPIAGGFAAGTTGWINLDETYDAVGVEAEADFFPADGLDLFVNANVMRILENDPESGETVVDGSASLFKANLGAAYRTPFRTDFSIFGNFVSSQTWRIREFDAAGNIEVNERTIPSRFLLSARVGLRPLQEEGLEIALTAWNFLGPMQSTTGLGYQEHPDGQPIGATIYGTVSYEF